MRIIALPLLDLLAYLIHNVIIQLDNKSVLFKERYEFSWRNDRAVLYPPYKSLRTRKINLAVKRNLRLIENAEFMHIKRCLHLVFDAFFLTHLFKHTLAVERICAVVAVFYGTLCYIRKVAHTSYRHALVDYPVNTE